MAAQVWDGVTRSATLNKPDAQARHALADRAKRYDWAGMFAVLGGHRGLINSTRPDGRSWFTPLHQAAYGGAPVDVVERLIRQGAWRLLRTADGDLAVEIARSRGHASLLELLEPRPAMEVGAEELTEIQNRFHEVIRGRAGELVDEHRLRLPELAVLTESETPEAWFPVPGMYGGFNYQLKADRIGLRLVSESWMRVVDGSGQRHEITAQEVRLVAEGFV